LHLIRDDTTSGTLLNSVAISGSGDIRALISGQFNPAYSYVRYRTVTGSDLEQSSSSSEEYSSSSSSSSSS